MSRLFDTHAHLSDEAFQVDFDDLISRTLEKCGAVLTIGCETYEDFNLTMALANQYQRIFAAIALHPANAPSDSADMRAEIRRLAQEEQVRAIGETGLDYHWMTTPREVQQELFRWHIELAKEVNKPVIIHDREAHRDCLDTLWAAGGDLCGGVFHAFSGSVEMMKEVVDHGFYIGIGGVVTFKNAKTIKRVAQEVPLSHLLLETDCPYLTPTPFRGKRNEPAYTQYVAAAIAELRGISVDEVMTATWHNACRLYQLNSENLTFLS